MTSGINTSYRTCGGDGLLKPGVALISYVGHRNNDTSLATR